MEVEQDSYEQKRPLPSPPAKQGEVQLKFFRKQKAARIEVTVHPGDAITRSLIDNVDKSPLFKEISGCIVHAATKTDAQKYALSFHGFTGGGGGFLLQPLLQLPNLVSLDLSCAHPIYSTHLQTVSRQKRLENIQMPWQTSTTDDHLCGAHLLMDASDKLQLLNSLTDQKTTLVFHKCGEISSVWINHFSQACIANEALTIVCFDVPNSQAFFKDITQKYKLKVCIDTRNGPVNKDDRTFTLVSTVQGVQIRSSGRRNTNDLPLAASS